MLAVLSDKKTYTDIERFAIVYLEHLKKYFGIKWERFLHFSAKRKIDPKELRSVLNK